MSNPIPFSEWPKDDQLVYLEAKKRIRHIAEVVDLSPKDSRKIGQYWNYANAMHTHKSDVVAFTICANILEREYLPDETF
jgi:hypothetical protein